MLKNREEVKNFLREKITFFLKKTPKNKKQKKTKNKTLKLKKII